MPDPYDNPTVSISCGFGGSGMPDPYDNSTVSISCGFCGSGMPDPYDNPTVSISCGFCGSGMPDPYDNPTVSISCRGEACLARRVYNEMRGVSPGQNSRQQVIHACALRDR